METYPILNNADEIVAFEIPNSYFISSAGIARFFRRCPGVEITRVRRLFALGEDVHVHFDFRGESFLVWEPYGDSSRLWVGLSTDIGRRSIHIDELEAIVRSHWPGPITAARGRLLARVTRAWERRRSNKPDG